MSLKKQLLRAAASATEDAPMAGMGVLAGERDVRRLLPQHLVLGIGKACPPFGVGELKRSGFGVGVLSAMGSSYRRPRREQSSGAVSMCNQPQTNWPRKPCFVVRLGKVRIIDDRSRSGAEARRSSAGAATPEVLASWSTSSAAPLTIRSGIVSPMKSRHHCAEFRFGVNGNVSSSPRVCRARRRGDGRPCDRRCRQAGRTPRSHAGHRDTCPIRGKEK